MATTPTNRSSEFEKRIGKAGQIIVELVHESEGSVNELAEAEFGYKQALSFSTSHILSAAAVVALPVEADGDGELQTYLAYGKVLSPSWIFQSSLRLKFPFEGANDGEAEAGGDCPLRPLAMASTCFPGAGGGRHQPVPLFQR